MARTQQSKKLQDSSGFQTQGSRFFGPLAQKIIGLFQKVYI
jgi:hypothetical protein